MAAAEVSSMKTLYELSVSAVAKWYSRYEKYMAYLPGNLHFDVCYQLYEKKRICQLGVELYNMRTFLKFLKATNRGGQLLNFFQACMEHKMGVAHKLVISNATYCLLVLDYLPEHDRVIDAGLRLGGFLNDAGWYLESTQVLASCKSLCVLHDTTPEHYCRTLDCCHKLLHAQTSYCLFRDATKTYELATDIVSRLDGARYKKTNHAALFTEFSILFFMRSEYDVAYSWAIKALKQLKPTLQTRVTIDVLRQAAKACTIKRQLRKAKLLIKQALCLARQTFDTDHPKYSDVLIDYGYYLLNSDSIANSVTVYKNALDIRKAAYGKTNLLVALAHDDLAYALYIHEYSSGEFNSSSDHVAQAEQIMEKLLPSDHLMLASAKRVKALILEEIAIGNSSTLSTKQMLLYQSELLQQSALQLVRDVFGEKNVQTAKLYGNLGRLYQSTEKFQEAEVMHLKAISIKEELLGPEDYELGLSLGHLASLYNYHMHRYKDAEKLYKRSIAISLKLFGKSFSGLEYDYRGLLHVYTRLYKSDKQTECWMKLKDWEKLRRKNKQTGDPLIDAEKRPDTIEQVLSKFFAIH